MKTRTTPERNDIIDGYAFEHDVQHGTRLYIEKDGQGPVITDHFADRRQYLVAGECVVQFNDYTTHLKAGSEIMIPKGTPARIIGQCSLVTTIEPVLLARFVTFDDQKLSFRDVRALKRANRIFEAIQSPSAASTEELLLAIGTRVAQYVRITEDYQQKRSEYGRTTPTVRW